MGSHLFFPKKDVSVFVTNNERVLGQQQKKGDGP